MGTVRVFCYSVSVACVLALAACALRPTWPTAASRVEDRPKQAAAGQADGAFRPKYGDDVPIPQDAMEERAIRLWRYGMASEPDHRRWVSSIAFSSALPRLLSSAAEVTPGVVIWDWPKGQPVRYWRDPVDIGGGVIAANGEIACWTDRAILKFAEISTGRLWRANMEYTAAAIVVDDSGKRVATAAGYGDVRVWDAATGTLIRALNTPRDAPGVVKYHQAVYTPPDSPRMVERWGPQNTCVAFSPDGRRVAAGGDAGLVRLWDAETGAYLKTFQLPTENAQEIGPIIALSFRPGALEAVVTRKTPRYYDLLLWNVEKGTYRVVEKEVQDTRLLAVWSPDGRYFAIGFHNGFVRIYTQEPIPRVVEVLPGGGGMRQDIGYPTALAFAPDSRHIAIGTTGPSLNIWSVPDPRLIISLPVWENRPVPPYKREPLPPPPKLPSENRS